MCYPVTCRQCGKTTWDGCGRHVEDVMRDVAPADRCPGHEKPVGRRARLLTKLFGR